MSSTALSISVGMKNSLKALLALQRKTDEQDRYFPAATVFVQRYFPPHTWKNPMWERRESPKDVSEAQEFLESARDAGYLERAVIEITGMSSDYRGFRFKQDKIAEIEKLVSGSK